VAAIRKPETISAEERRPFQRTEALRAVTQWVCDVEISQRLAIARAITIPRKFIGKISPRRSVHAGTLRQTGPAGFLSRRR
jgi:hypothetical protein